MVELIVTYAQAVTRLAGIYRICPVGKSVAHILQATRR
ncbi:Uncharacterised protein [Vibrio cholerae]|nr:Uncharacterised protein [Vibrio cholerae]